MRLISLTLTALAAATASVAANPLQTRELTALEKAALPASCVCCCSPCPCAKEYNSE
jgi:hypothetical protein